MATVVEVYDIPKSSRPRTPNSNPWLGREGLVFMKARGITPYTDLELANMHMHANHVPGKLRVFAEKQVSPDELDPVSGLAVLTKSARGVYHLIASLKWGWTRDPGREGLRYKEVKVTATRYGILEVDLTHQGKLAPLQSVLERHLYKQWFTYLEENGLRDNQVSYPKVLDFMLANAS